MPARVVDVHDHARLRDGAFENEQRVHVVLVPTAEVHARQPVALEHLDSQLAERIVWQEEAWLCHLLGRHQVRRAAARVDNVLGPSRLGREPPPLLCRCFDGRCVLVPRDPLPALIRGKDRDELAPCWEWRRHGGDGSVDNRAPHPGVVCFGLLDHRGQHLHDRPLRALLTPHLQPLLAHQVPVYRIGEGEPLLSWRIGGSIGEHGGRFGACCD